MSSLPTPTDEKDGFKSFFKNIGKGKTTDDSDSAVKKGEDTADHAVILPSGSAQPGYIRDSIGSTSGEAEVSKYEYNFNHKRRGWAYIFVNQEFDEVTQQNYRSGAEQDMRNFADAFRRLDFQIKPCLNYTVEQIWHAVNSYVKEDHRDEDCVVFAFSTHGDQEVLDRLKQRHLKSKLASDIIYGKNGIISLPHLVECFTDASCPSLAGKPKLFFFQACRGDQLAETVEVTGASLKVASAPKLLNPAMKPVEIPLHKDFLLAFSAPPGYYSFRRSKGERQGSWFVTAFLDIVKKFGNSFELLEMITAVNHHVALDPEFVSNIRKNPTFDQRTILPWTASMLCKSVRFYPKTTAVKT